MALDNLEHLFTVWLKIKVDRNAMIQNSSKRYCLQQVSQ